MYTRGRLVTHRIAFGLSVVAIAVTEPMAYLCVYMHVCIYMCVYVYMSVVAIAVTEPMAYLWGTQRRPTARRAYS